MNKPYHFAKEEDTEDNDKPIEFLCMFFGSRIVGSPLIHPFGWDNVILISTCNGLDIMYAYNDLDPQNGRIFSGHWNSGRKE